MVRGKIRNREQAQQIRDYSKLRYGNITPTDIDAFLEFNNKAFIFIELKYQGRKMPGGQKLALERLCNLAEVPGKHGLLIIASHEVPKEKDIDAGECLVKRYYYKGKWEILAMEFSLKEIVDQFLSQWGIR